MGVAPYLFFNGRCEEAMDFYKSALGAEIEMIMRFKEAPPNPEMKLPPGFEDKIMHAAIKVGGSSIMASDGMCKGDGPKFSGSALSYDVPNAETAEKVFSALAEGGQVQMPLAETFFSEKFGTVADKFGVSWMVVAPPAG